MAPVTFKQVVGLVSKEAAAGVEEGARLRRALAKKADTDTHSDMYRYPCGPRGPLFDPRGPKNGPFENNKHIKNN